MQLLTHGLCIEHSLSWYPSRSNQTWISPLLSSVSWSPFVKRMGTDRSMRMLLTEAHQLSPCHHGGMRLKKCTRLTCRSNQGKPWTHLVTMETGQMPSSKSRLRTLSKGSCNSIPNWSCVDCYCTHSRVVVLHLDLLCACPIDCSTVKYLVLKDNLHIPDSKEPGM